MKRKHYLGDPRYAKVLETMDLLNITDVSTERQEKNGTIVWRLPIKNNYSGKFVEVASFDTGYVRYQGRQRYSFGYSAPLSYYGSPGA